MAKPKTPNQKRKYGELNKRLAKYVMLVESIYEDLNLEAAKIVGITDFTIDSDRPFMWSDYPQTRKRIRDLQERFVEDIGAVIYSGTSEEWKNSNEVQDLLANKVLQTYGATIGKKKYEILYQPNNDALKAFQQRKDKGFTISDKLWNQSTLYKQELEEAISCAIQKGTSAITLSKQISKYLLDFPQLQKDYKERFGKASRAMDCEYRSIRLAASEINMAYRQAENLRWQQMDFVVGYEIKLSNNHTCNGKPFQDICDILAGKYPKDFQWTGWHPLCYSDDSEVLTNRGWKLFKDVLDDDLILSLNPNTRNIEWVEFIDRQCFSYYGEMVHFYNRSLDCLVTPEHNMVYLNKNDGKIKNCQAKEYTKGKGRFYRGCEYESGDVEFYQIDDLIIPFDLFCEFMGYWLSDGSTMSNSGVVISQQEGETARDKIVDCIKRMGFEPHLEKQKVVFYNTTIRNYLKIFGRCINKFVPYVIKNASKRQIRIFLDAFVLCDGYKRPCRSFIGNHGNEFKSDKDEIIYFTTSERMAGDLSELILKSGHRPSFSINKAGVSHKANGPIIKSNYDCYSIRECYSVTSSVFNKEIQHYDGLVYDLTLERNHIMYIRRNGKCFWGSNCRCYKIPILKTEEEFWEWDGRSEATTASVNEVKDVPDAFKKWINENIQRAKSWDSAPYFIRDNDKYIREDFKVNVYNKTEKTFVRKRRTNLAMSRVEYYNKIYPHIPEVQQAAVNAYTQAISSGNKGATSREINRRLRNGTEDEYVDVASRLISQALSRLPKYEGVVYRGETMSIKKLQERFLDHIGDVVSDKGFISSSLYMDTPMKFISRAGIPKSHKRVIFEIQSKNGRNISKISEFNGIFTLENQHEILFDKGTKFLVKKRRIEGDGTYRIILVEQ